jgi:hypothetical protein
VTEGSGSEPEEARRPFVSGSFSSVSICTFVPVKQVNRAPESEAPTEPEEARNTFT